MVEDFTKKFEHTVATFYSEFNKKTELKNWGIAEYEGKNIEFYTNPDFIKEYFTEPIAKHLEKNNISKNANLNLADFGGGDGVLVKELITQLNKIGYKNINGVNIDYTYKNLEKMDKNDDCKIIGIQGDTDQLPLKDNSVDIGVSRHLIQYFSKEKQPEILQNISNTLKPNSIFIMKWPGSDNPEQSPILTDFYAKLFGICVNRLSDKVAKNKYFVSYQEVEETAKKNRIKNNKFWKMQRKIKHNSRSLF